MENRKTFLSAFFLQPYSEVSIEQLNIVTEFPCFWDSLYILLLNKSIETFSFKYSQNTVVVTSAT